MSGNNNADNRGIDFIEGLSILFIGLKLSEIIDWSWGWVLSPIWITLIISMFKK